MKKVIAVFLLVILSFILTGCSLSKEITFENNVELNYCYDYNVTRKIADELGKDKKELTRLMEDSGIAFYGISKDKTYTVTIVKETTDFSKEMLDFSLFDDSQILAVAEEIAPNYIKLHENKEHSYIVLETVSYNAQGEFPASQYITVKNGSFYIITFTFSSEMAKEENGLSSDIVVDSITVNNISDNFTFLSIAIVLLLLIVVLVIIFVMISLIKDFKKTSKGN